MRRYAKYLTVFIMVLTVVFGFKTMKVSAAQVRTGTLGNNNGVQWSYDEDTKTLTLTGTDVGLGKQVYCTNITPPVKNICPDVEKIILKEFAPVGSMIQFFACLDNLEKIENQGFDTSQVTSMQYMLSECPNLKELDMSEWDTSNVQVMSQMCSYCSSLSSLDMSNLDMNKVTDVSGMFAGCENLKELHLSGVKAGNLRNINYIFYKCGSLTSLDLRGFNTSRVSTFESLFNGCYSLTDINVKGWDTSNVIRMSELFDGCSSLPKLDLSGWNTSKVTTMSSMFNDCSSLKELDVSGFDTSNVTAMSRMFKGCSSLPKLDLSDRNTSKVTDMAEMFNGCYSLEELDVSGFDTSKVTTMSAMFNGCSGLEALDVSGFDTSSVTTMSSMFGECRRLKALDVSKFDTSNVNSVNRMFGGCSSLSELDLSNFDLSKCSRAYFVDVFLGSCYSLSTISTPKVLPQDIEIELPNLFKDSKGEKLFALTSEHNNMVLTRAISIVCPTTMYPGETRQLYVKVDEQILDVSKNSNYEWEVFTSGGGYAGTTVSAQGIVNAANYNEEIIISLMDKDNDEMWAACFVMIEPPTSPVITTQPTDITKNEGETAVFKVDALANGISYQWQYKPAGSTQWYNSGMTGSNTASLNVVATAARNEYQYRCVIKDKDGNKVTSNPAKLTVVKAIDISGQPASATVNEGEKVTFKVEAKGTDLTYQWQFKSAGSEYWANSSMAGSKTNSITVEATSARNNYQYRCVVKDANGNKATTNAAKLTVEKSIEISGQPASASVSEGAKVTFNVDAKGTGLTYQWQFKSATATYWTNSTMAGSKTNSITVEATAARNGYQYRCVVKDAGGSKVTTDAAKLTVTKSIEITGQPASASVSEGAKVTFKVDAKGTGLTYQWQFKSATATYWSDSTMAGSKTNSITVEATSARNGYQYRCVVKDANGSKVTTNAAKLAVEKSIDITTQPASASVSEGAKVTFKVEAKGTGLTYQWQFKSATATYWTNSTMAGSKTNSITVEATSARNGYQYRCVVKDANGSKVTTNAAKLTVNKSIEITAQPVSATVAEGSSATFKVEAKGTGLTYQWQFKSASSSFWADSSMAGSKTGSITVTATIARNGYQYRCVVKDANGSKVTTNAAKLTVQ